MNVSKFQTDDRSWSVKFIPNTSGYKQYSDSV